MPVLAQKELCDLKNSCPKTHGDRAFLSLGIARDIGGGGGGQADNQEGGS